MLNEVLFLTQGDLTDVIKRQKEKEVAPFPQRHENGKEETERNNKAFYEGYQGEAHE